jgi:hypothetical protein
VKIIIDGTVYDGQTIDALSIRHALAFNRECAANGFPTREAPWTWQDVERIREEIAILPKDERERHPEALLLTAVSVWASRIVAGETVSFDEAISTPLERMHFVIEPGDQPDPEQDRTGAADPRRARPGSGRAGAPASRSKKRTSAKTSKRPSISD